MGQKTNPLGIRLGIRTNWISEWYSKKNNAQWIYEDYLIRQYFKRVPKANVSKIIIKRTINFLHLSLLTASPGIILGQEGKNIDNHLLNLKKILKKRHLKIKFEIFEITIPDLDARIVAKNIGKQISNRLPFRWAMKNQIKKTLSAGALGIKTMVAGRLVGADMARTEWFKEGSLPLSSFRADIDYGFYKAMTTYGIIGIKVWIHRPDQLNIYRSKQAMNKIEKTRKTI